MCTATLYDEQDFELQAVFLDNFDLVEKMDHKTAQLLQGEPSPALLALRAEYEDWGNRVLLLQEESCNQKQAQVVAGGLVYISMFRRPMLGCLNQLWQFIESFRGYPPFIKFPIPAGVKLEVARLVCLIPLAKLNFCLLVSAEVTASDASTTGGGIAISTGLTGFGQAAAEAGG